MSSKKAPSRTRRAYQFIESHRNEFSIQMMCRLLGVARAGYYAWLIRCRTEHWRMRACCVLSVRHSQPVTGSMAPPRVFLDLRERGETCSKHRVARLMRENGAGVALLGRRRGSVLA